MRRLACIFVSVATLSVFGGCEAVDMDDVESAGMSLVDEVFFNVVTPFNRALELADFYLQFIEGCNDSDFVNTLRTEFFGETVPFTDLENGGVEVEWWGAVEPADEEGKYTVTLDSHWMGLSPTYTFTMTAPQTYHIEYDSERNAPLTAKKGYALTLGADVHVQEHYACADRLGFLYEDSHREIKLSIIAGEDDEMVVFDLCEGGSFMNYPISGVFYGAVSGNDLNNFKIVFYGDYFEVIEAETISADVESLRQGGKI